MRKDIKHLCRHPFREERLDCGFGKASSSGESSDLGISRVDCCVLAARELEKKKKNEEEYLSRSRDRCSANKSVVMTLTLTPLS